MSLQMSNRIQSAPGSPPTRRPWSSRNSPAHAMFLRWCLSFKHCKASFPATSVTSAALPRTLTISPKSVSSTSNPHNLCIHSSMPMIWCSMLSVPMLPAAVADTRWRILLSASATRLAAPGKYLIELSICSSLSRGRLWWLQSSFWIKIFCSDGWSVYTDTCQ